MTQEQGQPPLPSAQGWVREHAERYVATDGAEGHIWNGYPTLVLDTIGRKSGQPRRQMLIYGEDSGNYIVVASKGVRRRTRSGTRIWRQTRRSRYRSRPIASRRAPAPPRRRSAPRSGR